MEMKYFYQNIEFKQNKQQTFLSIYTITYLYPNPYYFHCACQNQQAQHVLGYNVGSFQVRQRKNCSNLAKPQNISAGENHHYWMGELDKQPYLEKKILYSSKLIELRKPRCLEVILEDIVNLGYRVNLFWVEMEQHDYVFVVRILSRRLKNT